MFKILFCVCAIIAVSSCARMAFKIAAGFESLLNNVDTSFTCDDKNYGYYADVQNECKIFHVCLPVQKADGELKLTEQFSFVCGNQTVFNQESLTCTNVDDAIPCQDSTSLFDTVNAEFGVLRARQEPIGQDSQEPTGQVSQGSSGQVQQGGGFVTDNPQVPVEDATEPVFQGK